MTKTDILSGADLDFYAQIGLVIFVLVFTLVVLRLVFMKKSEAERMNSLPLTDDPLSEQPTRDDRISVHN